MDEKKSPASRIPPPRKPRPASALVPSPPPIPSKKTLLSDSTLDADLAGLSLPEGKRDSKEPAIDEKKKEDDDDDEDDEKADEKKKKKGK